MSGRFWREYQPVASDDLDEPFVVGAYGVFCFRRPDMRTQTNCLNVCATCTTFYLHCEICLVSADGKDMRSLVITSETRRVTFRRIPYLRNRQNARDQMPWTFVWFRLDDIRRARMQQCVNALAGANSKTFSPWRIFCFHCAACCAPETTTCSETTMEVIRNVWSQHIPGIQFYSPDDVFRYIREHADELGVDDSVAPNVPDLFIGRRAG